MGLSRDEAREIALTALLLVIGLRLAAGALQVVDELDHGGTPRSALGRFLAPVGATMGMLVLGGSLLVVLSPTGSVAPTLAQLVRRTAAVITVLGAIAVLHSLTTGFESFVNRFEFALRHGFGAALLAGAGWWVLHNIDERR